LKVQFLDNALKYATAYKAIVEQEAHGVEYRKFNRMEKSSMKKCQVIFEVLHKTSRLTEIEEYMYNENPYVRYITSAYCLFYLILK